MKEHRGCPSLVMVVCFAGKGVPAVAIIKSVRLKPN